MVYPDIGNHGQNDPDFNLGWFCFTLLFLINFDSSGKLCN